MLTESKNLKDARVEMRAQCGEKPKCSEEVKSKTNQNSVLEGNESASANTWDEIIHHSRYLVNIS